MLNGEFSAWPLFDEEEANAVRDVLLSNRVNYWTGDECRRFEKGFATWTGAKYAVALSNGTVALEVALKALDVSTGDEIIVTPRTYIASVSSIITVGAIPVFVDVDPVSQNITAEAIETAITDKTCAIVSVHMAGWPCEMDSIMALAETHGLYVVEDCAQAHGARYKDRSVGSIGHISAWSFCQDKIMTTGGEGGMLTTNDHELWSKVWSYKDHGKSWNAVYQQKHLSGFRWLHESFGTNARMTEMQAAIGRIQINRMNDWHQLRSENANAILEYCEQFPTQFRVPRPPQYIEHAWYKCYVFVQSKGLIQGWTRDRVADEINSHGVPCHGG